MPYKLGSKSCSTLAATCTNKLGLKVWQVNRESSNYVGKKGRIYVNWGCGSAPTWWNNTLSVINPFDAVARAGNKLATFQRLAASGNIPIPEWTADAGIAQSWFQNDNKVVARTTLNGHSGQGIHLLSSDSEWVNAPLYTKYTPKEREYRVHVFNGNVIDIQQKRVRSDYTGEVDKQIRNHHTGWIYCRENLDYGQSLKDISVAAVASLGLHFGAVDVIYSKKKNQYWVLEVNTAPGLEGQSVEIYSNAILGLI